MHASSRLPPLEAPVTIAEKRKLFFSFLFFQAAGTHHNVAHGCNAGGNGSDGHQRRQCNVEDLEWGRHGVPLELQRTQDKLHEMISIRSRPATIWGGGGLQQGWGLCNVGDQH